MLFRSSPGGVLTVEVGTDGDGRPFYAVSRIGRPVVSPSRLGFILTDAPKLERGFTVSAAPVVSFDQTWEQPWGEARHIRNRYNELRVTLTERAGLGRRVDVVCRLYDDGQGFRYELPELAALPALRIG